VHREREQDEDAGDHRRPAQGEPLPEAVGLRDRHDAPAEQGKVEHHEPDENPRVEHPRQQRRPHRNDRDGEPGHDEDCRNGQHRRQQALAVVCLAESGEEEREEGGERSAHIGAAPGPSGAHCLTRRSGVPYLVEAAV
jgi:hypothetical protein